MILLNDVLANTYYVFLLGQEQECKELVVEEMKR